MADDVTNLERRLQRLEDLEEIRRLVESYGYLLDHARWADYASLYAEDGKMRLGPVRADGPAEIERVTREQLGGDWYDAETGRVGLVHLIGSPQIEIDGDTATVEVMWTVVSRNPEGKASVTSQGHHSDELVRENGRWRFQRRRGFQDIP